MNLGRVHLELRGHDSVSTAGAWGSWSDVWAEGLPAVEVGMIQWEEMDLKTGNVPQFEVHRGQLNHLRVSPAGLECASVSTDGANLFGSQTSPTLALEPSELGFEWTDEHWHLNSSGLTLPGLHFAGEFQWPQLSGQGHLQITWDELPEWAMATVQSQHLVYDWNLNGESTEVVWQLDTSHWNVHVSGPDWLSIQTEGRLAEWSFELEMEKLPVDCTEIVPFEKVQLEVHGDSTRMNFQLLEDSVLMASGAWSGWPNLRSTMDGSYPHDMGLELSVHRWPPFVEVDRDVCLAEVNLVEGNGTFRVGQPAHHAPWDLEGTWLGQTASFDASFANISPSGPSSLPMNAHGTLGWNGPAGLEFNVAAEFEQDTLQVDGFASLAQHQRGWNVRLEGAGIRAQAEGLELPTEWPPLIQGMLMRTPHAWPELRLTAEVMPGNLLERLVDHEFSLTQTLDIQLSSNRMGFQAIGILPGWRFGDVEFDSTHVALLGLGQDMFANLMMEAPTSKNDGWPNLLSLDLHGDTAWHANLSAHFPDGESSQWSVEFAPAQEESTNWNWVIHEGQIPLGKERLWVDEAPLAWKAPLSAPWPPSLTLRSNRGILNLRSQLDRSGSQMLTFHGSWDTLSTLLSNLSPDLELARMSIEGQYSWSAHSANLPQGNAKVQLEKLRYHDAELSNVQGVFHWKDDELQSMLFGTGMDDHTSVSITSAFAGPGFADAKANIQLERVPLSWLQHWIDSSAAIVGGSLNASLEAQDILRVPVVNGTGSLDSMTAFVPSLGTTFKGGGDFVISPDEIVLENFALTDAQGLETPLLGVLMHDHFDDWNLDMTIMESPETMLIMNLPPSRNAPVYGTLYGGGRVNVSFWNNQVFVDGDVAANAPTQFKISLISQDDKGWNELVEFTAANTEVAENRELEESTLNVILDLAIEANPGVEVTVVMDEDNNANMVGQARGNVKLKLEDWDRMSLNGELTIDEGRYDFALGQLLRKSFVARPGGKLFWDGDPYQGTLNLDAVYRTRANVQPLLGANVGTGMRKEEIDVNLHLSGPMLKPNIGFDLTAPRSDRLVAEALSSALVDENERTRQAIALLSLQEFLPQEFNTLELGASGLQEYSIDMVTSQLSRWLSRINEDVEVGISYDNNSSFGSNTELGSDALQLAMKATFLDDKLEVEGALGSSALNQDALGSARLQNVRVVYHLNEAKGLELTGFSETQSSATQSAYSTNQGVGIRWHKSFDWVWPWRQVDAEE